MLTPETAIAALRQVQDPELHKDLVTLNMVKDIKISGDTISLTVELTTPACPLKETIRRDVTAALGEAGASRVDINFTAQVRGAAPTSQKAGLPGVKNIIAVGAGKGGVGKSTLAATLAAGLAVQGARVGLLDADIYGPSIPTLTGLLSQSPQIQGEQIIPMQTGPADNPLRVMSIGFIVPKEKALIWRGPMVHSAVKQFLQQVAWGELDYLIIDLPPGTGDVALSLSQLIPVTGAVVVATPQEVALSDARRAVRMFQQLGIEILGVVENMSYFVCEHGTEYDIFGRGGARAMAGEMGLRFLGEIPIDMAVRKRGDAGDLFGNFAADAPSNVPLTAVAQALAGAISIRNADRPEAKRLTLQVTE